jgi:C_GCAxxG_C_C family probable redox protein
MTDDRAAIALELHKKGYNCAQCVVCAYSDKVGIDQKTAFRMAEGFGAGMGGFQGVCGALTGVFMLTGLKTDGSGMEGTKTKQETYKKVKELIRKFEEMNGSAICRDLKGMTGGSVLRSCEGCITDGAKLAGDLFEGE